MTTIAKPPPRTKSVYQRLKPYVLPYLEHYRTDFTEHDLRWLRHNPGVPFIHMTPPTGTNLIPLHPADSERWPKPGERVRYLFATTDRFHMLRDSTSVIDCSPDEHRYVYFNGTGLHPITHKRTQDIRRAHIDAVERVWKAQYNG